MKAKNSWFRFLLNVFINALSSDASAAPHTLKRTIKREAGGAAAI